MFHMSNFSLLQLGSSRDQRLIHQMEFADQQVLIVRAFTSGIGSGSPETQTKEVRSTEHHFTHNTRNSCISQDFINQASK